MRYKVPRHVDYKAKILGPATFSQLMYVGVAGLIILFFYLILGTDSPIFYPLAFIVGGAGAAFAFVQVAGQPLPDYLQKMVMFQTSSREYIWEKKIVPMEMAIPKQKKKDDEKKEDNFNETQTTRKRRVGNISDRIETF